MLGIRELTKPLLLAAPLSLIGGLLWAPSLASAKIVEIDWNVTYVPNVNPDGLYARRAIGVNGMWPPPPVRVSQDDTLLLTLHNGLGDVGTAIHSHGLFFNGSGYFDGAVAVTQCPIPPGESLTYDIPVSQQYGTYWLHGHYLGQYVDGLRAPLIIEPRNPLPSLYQYDDEYTIVLADWYHKEHATLLKEFINPANPDGQEPVPQAGILYAFSDSHPTPMHLANIANGTFAGNNAALRFEKGKKYRLRVINMSALAMFWFGVGGHSMSIIELDATDVEPFTAEMIPLSIGQRVSVLVEAKEGLEVDEYDWPIMANMDPEMFDYIPDGLQLNITARITYADQLPSGRPLDPPHIFSGDYPSFDELSLSPLNLDPMLSPDVRHVMDAYLGEYDDGTNRGSCKTYRSPPTPSLLTALSMSPEDSRVIKTYGGADYSVIYGAQTHGVVLNHLEVVELVIRNWDDGAHPFHLHGHEFQVIHISDDMNNPVALRSAKAMNPIRRDVVQVPAEGAVTIRFRADNPGVWIFHCHVEWHLESGLASIFIEAPEQLRSRISMPQLLLDQCTRQGIPTTGNVVGLNSTSNFTGQP
ncbi:hypothetical protein DL93DRAFT_2054111 [Clavulina sp. PMI_390]|nr:hypothetical protein DL93DRAFT_2054111 [Clavulina sp. PMI_390]